MHVMLIGQIIGMLSIYYRNDINNHVPIQNNDICNDTLPLVNENGSSLLDFCKQTGYMLLNGRTGTDKGIGGIYLC